MKLSKIIKAIGLYCLTVSGGFAADLFVQKTPQGQIVAAVSMNKVRVNQALTLNKTARVTAVTPFNALNNYYYWAYRDDISQVLSLFTKKDNSWQRLDDKAKRGKSPFVHFSKLNGVHVNEKFLWGDYQIYKVQWQTDNQQYDWLDTIYCNLTSCQYSDMLLRFEMLPSAVTSAINRAHNQMPFNKKGLQQFAFFPMGLKHNPLTFYYNLDVYPQVTEAGSKVVWPGETTFSEFPAVTDYIGAVRKTNFGTAEEHQSFAAPYWQNDDADVQLSVPNYTYQGANIRIQDYSLAALQQKILSFDTISIVGEIETISGRLVLCQGLLPGDITKLFVMPVSHAGKLYVPDADDMTWTFVNTNDFAKHLNQQF